MIENIIHRQNKLLVLLINVCLFVASYHNNVNEIIENILHR